MGLVDRSNSVSTIIVCVCVLWFQGIIQPHSVKEVPLHITAECLEEVTTVAYFMIFGSSDAPLVRMTL